MTRIEIVLQKLQAVIREASRVVPTSENCPLKNALDDLDSTIDEFDAQRFMEAWKSHD